MKSILMGSSRIWEVYSEEVLRTLEQEAGLYRHLYTKDEVLQDPAAFRDTAYIFSTWGMPAFSQEEIRAVFPALRAVFYGAGSVQGFAQPFLASGIRVYSAWGANAVPVAEYTVAQIILANKGYFLSTRRYRSWDRRSVSLGYNETMPGNFDVTVGIIGAGMIGKLVIQMLRAYRLQVVVYDPYLSDGEAERLGVQKATLEWMFEHCQVVSNHVANLPATVGMLNYPLFSRMKRNAVFINTGRGAQVVEADLVRALREKPDMTALLDVTMPEPPEQESAWFDLENVFLTPHIAGSWGLEVQRMGEYMRDEYLRMSASEPCRYEVTLKMLETMA